MRWYCSGLVTTTTRQRNYTTYVIGRGRRAGGPLVRCAAVGFCKPTGGCDFSRTAPRWSGWSPTAIAWATAITTTLLRTVVDQFRVATEVGEVKALLAEGWQEAPDYTAGKTDEAPPAIGPLGLAGWQRSQISTG